MEISYVRPVHYGSHLCLLSTLDMGSETEECIFNFNFCLNIDSQRSLVAAILDSGGLRSTVGPLKLIKRISQCAGLWFPWAPKGEMAGGAAGERVPLQVHT